MQEKELIRSVKAEINARRIRGGAEDVPLWLWDQPEVGTALSGVVEQARREDFDGDWQEATLPLEETLDALAATLRKAARHMPPIIPDRMRNARNQLVREEQGEQGGEVSRPDVVRYDAGSVALAGYLSWRLRRDGFAKWYRRVICGGDYLTREEAWQFLTSSLPKVLSMEDYTGLGLCPVRTKGRLLSKYLRLRGLLVVTNMLMVDPKTRVSTATTDTLYSETDTYCAEVCLPSPNDKVRRLKRLVLHRSHANYSYVAHNYHMPKPYRIPMLDDGVYIAPHPAPFFPDEDRYVEGYHASLMGELIGGAEMLCSDYPVSIWDMLEALMTGTFPPQPSVEMFQRDTMIRTTENPDDDPCVPLDPDPLSAMGPVTLTVQPWVTPEALADAWRECRRSKGYSPSAMQADALRFVLSHTPPGEEFQWERLARQWQAERGELMTRGALHKLFKRAKNAILPACEGEA